MLNLAFEEYQLDGVVGSGNANEAAPVASRGKTVGRFVISILSKHAIPGFLLQL